MNIGNELRENASYAIEYFSGEAKKRFEFTGRFGPVIGLHGVKGGWTKDGLRRFMKENSVRGVLVFWDDLTDGLETYLPLLDREVENYPNPVIVAGSMGGMVALLYAKRYHAWARIDKIITVASPLAGEYRFLKPVGKSVREIQPGSPILKEIQNIHPKPNKVLSVFASQDMYVPHPESIKLNWPTAILSAQGHGDIQNHSKWIERILKQELDIPPKT